MKPLVYDPSYIMSKPYVEFVDNGSPSKPLLGDLKIMCPDGYKYAGLEPGGPRSPAALGLPMEAKPSDTHFNPLGIDPLDEEEDESDDDDEGYYDDDDWIDEDEEEEEEDDDLLDLASTPNRTFPAYMFQVQSNIADSVVNAIKAAMEKIKEDDTAWRSPVFLDDEPPRFQGLMAMMEEEEKKAVTASLNISGAIVAAMETAKMGPRMPELNEIWVATDKAELEGKCDKGVKFKIVRLPNEETGTYGVDYLDSSGKPGGGHSTWAASRFKFGEAVFVESPIDLSRFPHKCPRCKSAAYQGGGPNDIDCTNKSCQFYRG